MKLEQNSRLLLDFHARALNHTERSSGMQYSDDSEAKVKYSYLTKQLLNVANILTIIFPLLAGVYSKAIYDFRLMTSPCNRDIQIVPNRRERDSIQLGQNGLPVPDGVDPNFYEVGSQNNIEEFVFDQEVMVGPDMEMRLVPQPIDISNQQIMPVSQHISREEPAVLREHVEIEHGLDGDLHVEDPVSDINILRNPGHSNHLPPLVNAPSPLPNH